MDSLKIVQHPHHTLFGFVEKLKRSTKCLSERKTEATGGVFFSKANLVVVGGVSGVNFEAFIESQIPIPVVPQCEDALLQNTKLNNNELLQNILLDHHALEQFVQPLQWDNVTEYFSAVVLVIHGAKTHLRGC